ncbi:ODA2 [Symbiodinium sp. CCMP2592]|nr:ODA2 [Symbiodinium sp. CCMP2592]
MAVVAALLCGIAITVDCGTLEPDTGWPPTESHIELFEDLGNLSFPVEASSLAQRYFDQGFRFIAAFDFRRAVISFRAAQTVDPGCVMCIWGESFALGPNLNSFDEPRLLQSLPLAYEKAQQAARMSALKSYDRARSTANRVEIGLVRALLTRYRAVPEDYVAQEHELTHAFADEMAHVLADLDGGPKSHPNIAALVADAWMNTRPWNYWEPSGRMRREAEQALQILQQALLSNPRHAFCVHLYVHVTEASGNQSLLHLARPFAELLPNLMPGAPHLVHMSFHTLMHTGDFYVADVDNGRASSLPRQIYPMHNLDTLSWVCRIQGRSACSLDAAKSLEHLALPLVGTGVFETGFPPARFASVWPLTLLAFGRLTAITSAQLPEQCKLDPVLGGMWHFAKGAALSKQGYVSRAREELEQLQQERLRIQARMAIPSGMAWQNFNGSKDWAVYPADAILRLASLELKAHVARAEHADELSAWKEALMAEAELPYDEPPAWYLPVANRFGEALARLGHAEEADSLWQKSLSILPHNGWAIFGLVQLCLNSTSSASDCAQLETKFNQSWRHADVVLSDPADVCLKTDLESKFAVIFHNYGQELEALKDFYEKHRVSPQIVRNMPPVAGNIMWSRQLLHRIMEPMQKFHHNPLVVAGGKEAKRVIKVYNKMAKTLVEFEIVWHQAWVSSIETTKAGLNATLLTKLPEDQKSYYVNFDPEILQLIRETKCLDRMGHVEIPESARMLLLQEENFRNRIGTTELHALGMANEPNGEPVIAIDSDEEGEHAKCADAEAAATALAAEPPREYVLCGLTLPPSRGLLTPQPVGEAQLWLQDQSLRARCLYEEEEPGEEDEQDELIIPLAVVSDVEVKGDGQFVILSLSPPLAPTGFAVEFMAEGHRISTVTLSPFAEELRPVLATLMSWLRHLTLHGPRSLGLTPRPAVEPFALRYQGTVLEERDLDLLEDEQWLNDTIMDFFMRLAIDVAAPAKLQEELYVAKTQFFTRLTACGASSGEKGWENVKTWTRSVSGGVASQRVLIYPVNEGNLHWCVFFVCHPHRAIELADSSDEHPDAPRIVCLDSAWEPVPKDEQIKLLKGYLRRELFNNPLGGAGFKLPANGNFVGQAAVKAWKAAVTGLEKMRALDADVPKQQNVYDCGLYVLEFVLYLLRAPDQFAMLGLESHQEWFDQSVISHRRGEMKRIVQRLLNEGRKSGQADVAMLLRDKALHQYVRQALTSEPAPAPSEAPWQPPSSGPEPNRPPALQVPAVQSAYTARGDWAQFAWQTPARRSAGGVSTWENWSQAGDDDFHRSKRARLDAVGA